MPVSDADLLRCFLLGEAHSQAQVTQVLLKNFESRHATIIAFQLEALHVTHVALLCRHRDGENVSNAPDQATVQGTLLVVDDQPSVCVSLEYLLGVAGYRVLTAGSGMAAEEIIKREVVDGALIDIHMPGRNGFTTCGCLQKHSQSVGRELRVWFMTGAFTSDLEKHRAELGGLAILRKPFDFPRLLDELNRGLASPLPPVATIQSEPALREIRVAL
jgi:CheY-like chemotaxis protein